MDKNSLRFDVRGMDKNALRFHGMEKKMRPSRERKRLDERHTRVSGLVWGLLLILLGVLLGMNELGLIEEQRLTEHSAERAVDGNPGTRWSSAFDDDESLDVDLGSAFELTRVRLVWEQAHARVYELQVSEDGSSWETVVRVDDGDGGTDEHEIDARGRWVRIHGIERATGYGFSLWEVEVYGRPGPGPEAAAGPSEAAADRLLSRDRPVTASSRESVPFPFLVSFWFTWWPLFVVAAGLPHLLVPRSDGEEIGGLVTVAVGGVFLLDNLDWSLRQAAPIALVVVGLVVVMQGFRQTSRRKEPAADEPPRPG
jgi:hypothetical protein